MFSTPSGIPALRASSATATAVRGVSLAGFSTTVHPAARAGDTCGGAQGRAMQSAEGEVDA